MTEWFPSREWLESYRATLDEDETYAAESEGWGVDFDGDFLFVLTRLPIEEMTIGDLPDELTANLFDRIDALGPDEFDRLRETATPAFEERLASADGEDDRERFREALAGVTLADVPEVTWPALEEHIRGDLDSLLDQLETYVVDDTRVHAYVELEDGDCLGAELVEDPSACDPGFELEAPYETWTELLEGADVIESVMSNEMDLEGDVTRVLHYGDAAAAMGDVAGETDARYLF
ncbi:sterol carrier protein [Haloterrigena alkaliphila]|uniref:Sterol carrier protein n=1 Tax=Haloterrigena alkaliphila TaxID=2816475 RepID=A0A8A2VGR5_9EURY|nr:sterol carrier protein [Haloterrigena alkaliphila]QSW99857.1 sterol carrier protein [Haloterrigena alkaliphila]